MPSGHADNRNEQLENTTAAVPHKRLSHTRPASAALEIPAYLRETYPWAYVAQSAVQFWDRPLLVQLILFGQYRRLVRAVTNAIRPATRRAVQIACVYGDFTVRVRAALPTDASLDVIDIVPAQLQNLQRKLGPTAAVRLHCQDSRKLSAPDGYWDTVVLFFLLHEQPEAVRQKTLSEALRVLAPGGQLLIVDYHKPARAIIAPVFRFLEPFAKEFVGQDLPTRLLALDPTLIISKRTAFGGLYQILRIARDEPPA